MKKKLFATICALCLMLCTVFGFAGCFDDGKIDYGTTSSGIPYHGWGSGKAVTIDGIVYALNEEDQYFSVVSVPYIDHFTNADILAEIDGIPVTKIESLNAPNMKTAKLPDSITSVEYRAFWYCYKLESITLSNAITSIGSEAFRFDESLTSITLPDSVTTLGFYVFGGCKALKSVTLSQNLTSIKDHTFIDCSSLLNITIPASVKSIGYEAFAGCFQLEEVTIENGVREIGKESFKFCNKLKSITLPISVEEVGERAFSGCSALESVTIKNHVLKLNKFAFENCKSIKEITFDGTQEQWAYLLKINSATVNNVTVHCTDGDIVVKD